MQNKNYCTNKTQFKTCTKSLNSLKLHNLMKRLKVIVYRLVISATNPLRFFGKSEIRTTVANDQDKALINQTEIFARNRCNSIDPHQKLNGGVEKTA